MGDKADGIGFRISSKRLSTLWTQRANRLLDKLFGFETFNAAFQAAPECPDSDAGASNSRHSWCALGVVRGVEGRDTARRRARRGLQSSVWDYRRPGHRRGPTVDTIRRLRDRRALVGATPALAKLHIDCRGRPGRRKATTSKRRRLAHSSPAAQTRRRCHPLSRGAGGALPLAALVRRRSPLESARGERRSKDFGRSRPGVFRGSKQPDLLCLDGDLPGPGGFPTRQGMPGGSRMQAFAP